MHSIKPTIYLDHAATTPVRYRVLPVLPGVNAADVTP